MGVQIYIHKESLKRLGIPVVYSTETVYGSNPSEEYSEEIANVHGLSMLMETTDNAIYHDANRWGVSRKPLLAFIEKHSLKAGEDWFEA